MDYAFLSYSRNDAAFVGSVSRELARHSLATWVDRQGIAGGEQWRSEIVSAIHSAKIVVLFLSPHSVRSVNVRKELDIAEGAKVRVLPVAIAPTEIPKDLQYQLAGVQLIELWRETGPDPMTALLRSVERALTSAHGDHSPARGSIKSSGVASRERGVDLSELGGRSVLEFLTLRRLFGRGGKR